MRKSVKHPLGLINWPRNVDADSLLLKARTGDALAKKALIEGHINFGFSIVCRYAERRSLISDIVSEMLYALVQGIELLCKMETQHPNIRGYLSKTITGRINYYIRQNRMFTPLRGQIFTYREEDTPNFDFHKSITIDDLLKLAIGREKEVIKYKVEGRKNSEIAKLLNVSKMQITRDVDSVRRRFQNV